MESTCEADKFNQQCSAESSHLFIVLTRDERLASSHLGRSNQQHRARRSSHGAASEKPGALQGPAATHLDSAAIARPSVAALCRRAAYRPAGSLSRSDPDRLGDADGLTQPADSPLFSSFISERSSRLAAPPSAASPSWLPPAIRIEYSKIQGLFCKNESFFSD
ncbi:uncharacterized protein LOC119277167 [Triticum dicoccoides]|uniref:uncharacterized protein LOC119277167 n=1 Tax=Triticum dicoccoides TaxID=85692 RepID=UPI0018907B09|nr:uncharacterized protein LOC119277167 [Triticum dicoccoides]